MGPVYHAMSLPRQEVSYSRTAVQRSPATLRVGLIGNFILGMRVTALSCDSHNAVIFGPYCKGAKLLSVADPGSGSLAEAFWKEREATCHILV